MLFGIGRKATIYGLVYFFVINFKGDEMSNKLLDLCRLNLMEESAIDHPPLLEADQHLEMIQYKKKQLAMKIISNRPKVSEEVMAQHVAENTVDGTYLGSS